MIVLSELKIKQPEKLNAVQIVLVNRKQMLDYNNKKDVYVIVCSRKTAGQIDADAFENLRLVQLTSAGYDYIDLGYFHKHHIWVANVGDIYATAMAETVILGMLKIAKKFYYNPRLTVPRLLRNYHYIVELKGKYVMILGTGNVGRETARRLKAFDMTIWGYSKHGRPCDGFERVTNQRDVLLAWLGQADYVINALPLSSETEGFVNQELLSCLKPESVIIGIGRMKTFDTVALYKTLKNKKIKGSVLDIFERIPNPVTNPFRRLPNTIILPSVAAVSVESSRNLYQLIERNITRVQSNQIPDFLLNGEG